jgi:flagellar motility protein MotE (MotC chaperone)
MRQKSEKMKKILFSLCILFAAVTFVSAQDRPAGGQGRGAGAEAARQRIKDELKLTDAQADSLTAIQREFQVKNREVMTNTTLSDDDKKTKTKELDTARRTKLKGFLNDEQLSKLDAYYENMRKMREQRQGNN